MIAPTFSEIVYVALGFGVVGLYIAIVHQFIKSAERD
jgi:hypothetical protein